MTLDRQLTLLRSTRTVRALHMAYRDALRGLNGAAGVLELLDECLEDRGLLLEMAKRVERLAIARLRRAAGLQR